jgi:hypothetical protein
MENLTEGRKGKTGGEIILLTAATGLTLMQKGKVEPQVKISCRVLETWQL